MQVLGIFFSSYALYYFSELYESDSSKLWEGQECFLDTSRYKRFLQAVRDIILQEVREQFFDTTRGAKAILRSYERYESDSLKRQEKKRSMPIDLLWLRLIV